MCDKEMLGKWWTEKFKAIRTPEAGVYSPLPLVTKMFERYI